MAQAEGGEAALHALRRRRTLLLVVLPVAGLLFAHPQPLTYALGLLAAAAGQGVRLWAAGHIVKAVRLTTTGPYAYVRNPLYLGSLLITVGWGAMSGRLAVAAVLLAMFALTHGLAIRFEERFLRERFGPEFEEYCRRVPCLIPRPTAHPRSAGNYSLRRALQCDGECISALGVAALAAAYAARFWW